MEPLQLTDEQLQLARERADEERRYGAYAVKAYCKNRILVIEMANGSEHHFPIARLEVLSGASDTDIADVAIDPSGLGLHWESIDWDLSLPHLLQGVFGSKRWMKREEILANVRSA